MATDLQTELSEFHAFLSAQLRAGVRMSPEEALDAWRSDNPDGQVHEENVKALKAALRDMESGDRGIPFADFDRDFRQKHSIPPDE